MPFLITSMLDMFTIILLFLLNFLDPSATDTGVELPHAAVQTPTAGSVVLTVATDRVAVDGVDVSAVANGRLSGDADGAEAAHARVRERLAAAANRARKPGEGTELGAGNAVLSVQADRAVPYRLLAELLSDAREAGFGQFRFVVVTDTAHGK
jgi:biopolymer transport protein ExbD